MTRLLSTLLAVLCLWRPRMPAAADEHEPPNDARGGRGRARRGRREVARGGRGPACARARGLAVVAELGVPGKGLPSRRVDRAADRSTMSSPSCAPIRRSRTPSPTTCVKLAEDGQRRRRPGQRPEDGGPVLARPDAGARRMVALEGRLGRRRRPRHRRAGQPPRPRRPGAARLRLREQRYERGRRQRPRNLGRRHHRRQPERRLRDRRHQLERQDPAGQDHVRHGHRRYRRPDRRDHLGREPRRNRHQHERRVAFPHRSTCRTR